MEANLFKSLGFNEYESKALAGLIRLKIASTKELGFDSKVPQNKLYGILRKFEILGIISEIPGEIKKYKIINIKTFISGKLKEKEEEIRKLKQNLKNINETSSPLFSLILGQKTIMNKLSEHNQKVKKEILSVQRNWKYWAQGIRQMKKTINRGIKVRMIGIINKETEKRAIEWKKIGCKIKAYNPKFGEFPLRFSIFDGKEARITLGKPEIQNPKDYVTIWTTSQPLIEILKSQFEQIWRGCEDF